LTRPYIYILYITLSQGIREGYPKELIVNKLKKRFVGGKRKCTFLCAA
jgi:hypothetical protein